MRRRTLLRSAAATATIGGAGIAGASRNRGGRDATGAQQTTTEGEGTPGVQETTEDGTTAEEETTTGADAGGEFTVTSPAWENGGEIPTQYTCEGEDASPPLEISNPPEGTEAFALVMDDPDAPNPPFVHWLLWNVPADAREIPEGVPTGETVDALDGAAQGANGTEELGYLGPCPPEGDPQHTYLFSLYALESPLDLDPGATYQEVLTALFPAALARAQYVGQYERG